MNSNVEIVHGRREWGIAQSYPLPHLTLRKSLAVNELEKDLSYGLDLPMP